MNDSTEKSCPNCGQRLRFPKDIGGMLMACPTCGKRFYSDFRLRVGKGSGHREWAVHVFEMPERIVSRIVRFFTSKIL